MPVQLYYITVFYSTVLIPKWFMCIHWHYDPQLNKICFERKFSVWAQKKEIFFHFKAIFLNQLSHATKVSVMGDMGQNSGWTEGPVTCDWPNQSKWYSTPSLWPMTSQHWCGMPVLVTQLLCFQLECIYIETIQQLEDVAAPNPNCSVYVQYSTVGHFGFVLWLCASASDGHRNPTEFSCLFCT